MVFRLLMPVHFLRLIFPSSFIKCLSLASILQESGQYLSFQNMQQPCPPQFHLSSLLVHGHSTYCIKLQAFVYLFVSFCGLSSSRTESLTLISGTYFKSQPSSAHGRQWVNAFGIIAPSQHGIRIMGLLSKHEDV